MLAAYICHMKKFVKAYRRWCYRRLYQKLMFEYIKIDYVNAIQYANVTFEWITGREWIELIRDERPGGSGINPDASVH